MTEQMHIIDYKKVVMTDSEWKVYQDICTTYDNPPQQKGKDLFQNLFESNEQGIIQFLRPPTNTCTYEVFLFMVALMVHQRLREAAKVVQSMQSGIDDKLLAAMNRDAERISALEKRVVELEGKVK